jgi:hypothetical protein
MAFPSAEMQAISIQAFSKEALITARSATPSHRHARTAHQVFSAWRKRGWPDKPEQTGRDSE